MNLCLTQFETEFPMMITNWLNDAKFRTPHLLSKLCNIRPNTIYDLMKGNRKVTKLHPARIVKILACIDGIETKDVLVKYQPVLSEIERLCGDSEVKVEENNDQTEVFAKMMANPVAMTIYTMTLRPNGVSALIVRDQFGNFGENILKELIENKLVVKSGSNFHPVNSELTSVGTTRIGSINTKAFYEIQDLYTNLDKKVTQILSRSENKGDIPFFASAKMESMIKE
jgi:hypothetical protein